MKGYTLIETLIAAGLGVVLLGCITMFAVLGLRLWHAAADKTEVDEAVLTCMQTFRTLLLASDVNSVYINPSGVAAGLSFLSGVGPDGTLQSEANCPGMLPCPLPSTSATVLPFTQDGLVIWQHFQILYYNPSDQTLRLATQDFTSTTTPPAYYRLTQYTPADTDHRVAGDIQALEISDAPFYPAGHVLNPTPTQNPIYIRITGQKPGVAYTMTLPAAVSLDNSPNTGGFVHAVP
jgi:hypothetical protein